MACQTSFLYCTTALGSAAMAALLVGAAPARAQIVPPPGTTAPYTLDTSGHAGATGSKGTNGGNGSDGSAATEINLDFQSLTLATSGDVPAVDLTANGGIGGAGGNSTAGGGIIPTPGNGGKGAVGGVGGPVTVRLDDFTVVRQISGGVALSVSSNGAAGGAGGLAGDRGTSGAGAAGGDGGAILLDTDLSSRVEDDGPGIAVQLLSQGGNGGEAGQGTETNIDHASGPAGGAGGNGGVIQALLSGSITSAGSGLLALSTGGDGGAGGEVGTSGVAGATGGNGGAGGDGGDITITAAGSALLRQAISAVGASGPGTGGTVVLTLPNGDGSFRKVSVPTSLVTVGLGAQSSGGVGADGGDAQGGAGKGKGGAGGVAGNGGGVTITASGVSITTSRYAAVGMMGLSDGGDGGNGASAGAIFVRKGGNGALGGNGGPVVLKLAGVPALVTTSGADSDAVIGLSVGGGGGYGGNVGGGGVIFTTSIGGQGGNGGDGGQVDVLNGNFFFDGNTTAFFAPYIVSTKGAYARALVALSIGGGGGRGGDAVSAAAGPLALSIGGTGGTGGDASSATIMNFGTLQTAGAHSVGASALSVGGGGGDGGAAVSLDVGTQLTAAIAVGGSGGNGGNGAAVTVNNFGQIITAGSDAHGVEALSVGGGGGNGGSTVAQTLALNADPDLPSVTLTTAVGGSGGKGGVGGVVGIGNTALVMTQGEGAIGVLAQSIGGGGGDGGDSSAMSTAYTQSDLTVTVGVGGKGGAGGDSNAVSLVNSGLVATLNGMAPGVMAQSIGGGGGIGGFGQSNTGSYKGGNGPSAQISVVVGGRGGDGGNGGNVTVDNFIDQTNQPLLPFGAPSPSGEGGILTQGDDSYGILAQSVGGGGGNGGDATAAGSGGQININVAVGGNGGKGGNAGAVTVNNGAGSILTSGGASAGILAQSVGGGGGNGGSAATSAGADPQYAIPDFIANGLGFGGKAQEVADGIWDFKDNVQGAFNSLSRLQQIKEGYEKANNGDIVPDESKPSKTDITVDVGAGIGGGGGAAGSGGPIVVANAGSIATTGPESAGINALSVGGGGGIGGGSNPATSNDEIASTVVSGVIGVGGGGGASGAGGPITITNVGTIATMGDVSPAIMAQSVGGGGGAGGATLATSGIGSSFNIALGGGNGASGSGGAVSVTTTNTVATVGNDSPGIFAQSIGGGGGLAFLANSTYDPTTGKGTSNTGVIPATPITVAIPGNPGAGSNGGAVGVTLQSNGTIATQGRNAYGILAQSVGGGGGVVVAGQSTVTPSSLYSHNSSSSNNGGTVSITSQGQTSIVTHGAGAVGMLAQSIGGGGGIVNGMAGVVQNPTPNASPTGSWRRGRQHHDRQRLGHHHHGRERARHLRAERRRRRRHRRRCGWQRLHLWSDQAIRLRRQDGLHRLCRRDTERGHDHGQRRGCLRASICRARAMAPTAPR